MTTRIKVKPLGSHQDMLEWQFRTLLAELSQVTLHASDESCPCNQVALEPAEYCLGKHLLNVSSLASETAMMDPQHREILDKLSGEALEQHLAAKDIYCQGGTWPDLAGWSRTWRKKLETVYYACDSRKKIKLAENPGIKELLIELFETLPEQNNTHGMECGMILCRNKDNQLVRGSSSCGTEEHKLSLDPTCPRDSRPVAVVHTHPGGNPQPSEPDIQAAHKSGLVICNITREHGLNCIKSESGSQSSKSPDKTVNLNESRSKVFYLVSPDKFKKSVSKNKRIQFLTAYSTEELSHYKTYLSPDGLTGYAITPDHELINIFNNGPHGEGSKAIAHAVENGADHLNCYDGPLYKIYSNHGFKEYKREKWDDKFAPPNWNYKNDKRPDIVYMRLEK